MHISLPKISAPALLATALCATTGSAHADCPEGTQAACVPHDEGVASPSAASPHPAPPAQPPPPVQQPMVQQPSVQQPSRQQPSGQQPSVQQPSGQQPTPQPLPSATLAIGMTVLSQGPELGDVSLSPGVGLFGLFERRAGKSLGLTFRADYISHPTDNDPRVVFSGFELMALAGLRTMMRAVHARIEAGVTRSTMEALVRDNDPGVPLHTVSWTDIYPVIGIGGGLHVGRIRLHASVLYASNFAANPTFTGRTPQMPLRFMGVLGVDLWRRRAARQQAAPCPHRDATPRLARDRRSSPIAVMPY